MYWKFTSKRIQKGNISKKIEALMGIEASFLPHAVLNTEHLSAVTVLACFLSNLNVGCRPCCQMWARSGTLPCRKQFLVSSVWHRVCWSCRQNFEISFWQSLWLGPAHRNGIPAALSCTVAADFLGFRCPRKMMELSFSGRCTAKWFYQPAVVQFHILLLNNRVGYPDY